MGSLAAWSRPFSSAALNVLMAVISASETCCPLLTSGTPASWSCPISVPVATMTVLKKSPSFCLPVVGEEEGPRAALRSTELDWSVFCQDFSAPHTLLA